MMRVLGSNELVEDVFANDLCIGCGACVNLCPYYKNHKGKTTRLFACDLNEGRCYAFCPKTEVDMDELSKRIWGLPYDGGPIGNYRQVLSARAGEEMHQGSFQAGGTVSSLITFALKVDIIDAAALTDREGTTPVPRLVTNWEDVVTCASTKFMASPTLAALNTGIDKGFTSLGVVGTPCQMTAAAQMRTNPMQKSDFADPIALTVGLFCNWSLDARQLTTLLSVKCNISKIRGMNIPPPPADMLILQTDDGRIDIPLSEVKPLIPHTCFICPDMTSEWSDVSVGMFEGRPGWNTLIVRSEEGANLIENACESGYLQTEKIPEKYLSNLCKAAGEKKARALRMLVRRDLINTEGKQCSAVRMPSNVVNKLLNR